MHVPDCFLWLIASPSASYSAGLWAYVGLGPGQEFIPQFVALLGFAATALIAVLQWPITAVLTRLTARKRVRREE